MFISEGFCDECHRILFAFFDKVLSTKNTEKVERSHYGISIIKSRSRADVSELDGKV